MFDLPLCVLFCVNLFLYAECSIPEEKLCVSPSCKEPISKAQGSVKYSPPKEHMLGFDRGQEITILSKSKNENDYWEANINGKIGYVPSKLIKEVKVFHKVSDLIPVPVKLQEQNKQEGEETNSTLNEVHSKDKITGSETPPPAVETPSNLNINPAGNHDSFHQAFKVIEGTTIYEDITPSSTVSVKSNTQTATVEVPEDGRATLPPEVIKLNDNYKGQLDMKNIGNIVIDRSDENIKVESKDLEEEEEETENDYEEEVGEDDSDDDDGEDDDDEDDGGADRDGHAAEDEVLKEKKNMENERDALASPKMEEMDVKEEVVNVEKDKEQINVNIDSKQTDTAEKVIEVAPLQEEVQTSTGPLSGWNLLNNFKAKPPQVETNLPLEDSSRNEIPQMPQEVPAALNESQNIINSAVNTPHSVAEDATPAQFSSSPPQISAQEFMPSAQTPPPATEQNIIFNQLSVAADTPPGNTYHLEPNIEENTSEAAPVTFQPVTGTLRQDESLIGAPIDEEEKKYKAESTTETVTSSPLTATPETLTFSELSQAGDIPPTSQPASDQPEPEIIHEKAEVQTSVTSDVTETWKATEMPKLEVTEPAATESTTSEPRVEEKVDLKEDATYNSKEDSSVLSGVTTMFSSWFASTPKQQIPDEVFPETQSFEKSDQKEKLADDAKPGTCESGLGLDCEYFTANEPESTWISWVPGGLGVESLKTSSNTFLYLVVTAVTVLLFTLGHNFIEKKGKTGPLIAKINKLEQELLVTSKECSLLRDEVQSARDKISLYENSANDELVLTLQAELEESKRVKAELESSIEVLQQELDAATEAGLDLNKMLSEVLTQKGGSETLLKSVENLQSQLDRQQRVIDEMTKKLGAKNQENEILQSALETSKEKSEALEEELNEIKHNLNLHLKEKENLTQDLNSQITQLKARINQLGQAKEKEIAKLKKEYEEVQKNLKEAVGKLTVKEEEVKSLKEAFKKLKTKQDVKLDTVFDVCKVSGELAKEKKENQVLTENLQKEEAEKKGLAESLKILDAEMQKLKKAYEEAEQKKDEAEKKLEVLSTYFKEKETQLQKELGLQEALWAQKKGDEKAVYNMMKSLQEEVESYKSQNETLKNEILDQERGLKNQIATLEQKAHENWVAARQAERKLEEAKQEMAQLRNRLTLAEKNSSNAEGKSNFRSSEELNGVEAASPIMHDTASPLLFPPLSLDPGNSNLLPPGFMPPPMFMPPPLGGFMPPPPFLPGDRRPPPLGRMSSPPLNNRFSPSSPADYPFERLSSPPLSPSAANYRSPNEDRDRYRHRSPPYPPPPLHPRNWEDNNEMPGFIPISSQRDSRRDHKGSNLSSEHSSSESLDKSSRHSGRV